MSTSRTRSCVVVGCSSWRNSRRKQQIAATTFYSFPTQPEERRDAWIQFVVQDRPNWIPNKSSRICSAHFLNNAASPSPSDPNYNPTIRKPKPRPRKVVTTSTSSTSSTKQQLKSSTRKHRRTKPSNDNPNDTKLFKCTQCTYTSKWKHNVTQHENGKHLGVRVPCIVCKKLFSQPSSMWIHVRRFHPGHYPGRSSLATLLSCTHCAFTTQYNHVLKRHELQHAEESSLEAEESSSDLLQPASSGTTESSFDLTSNSVACNSSSASHEPVLGDLDATLCCLNKLNLELEDLLASCSQVEQFDDIEGKFNEMELLCKVIGNESNIWTQKLTMFWRKFVDLQYQIRKAKRKQPVILVDEPEESLPEEINTTTSLTSCVSESCTVSADEPIESLTEPEEILIEPDETSTDVTNVIISTLENCEFVLVQEEEEESADTSNEADQIMPDATNVITLTPCNSVSTYVPVDESMENLLEPEETQPLISDISPSPNPNAPLSFALVNQLQSTLLTVSSEPTAIDNTAQIRSADNPCPKAVTALCEAETECKSKYLWQLLSDDDPYKAALRW